MSRQPLRTNLSERRTWRAAAGSWIERSNRWDFRLDNGEHCSHLALLLLRLCSRNAPPSWMLRSRRPLSPHSRSAIHLEATLNLFVKMAVCRPVVLPPPSLSCLPPASSVLSPRRCTLRSGPTRSHAAPPITICEAQHPRHASIWKPCPTARSLGLQAKHEHTVLTQCQVGAHCVSESAVPAAPPSLLSGGCYCCCGDRLGTRRWLYLRCLLVVVPLLPLGGPMAGL